MGRLITRMFLVVKTENIAHCPPCNPNTIITPCLSPHPGINKHKDAGDVSRQQYPKDMILTVHLKRMFIHVAFSTLFDSQLPVAISDS